MTGANRRPRPYRVRWTSVYEDGRVQESYVVAYRNPETARKVVADNHAASADERGVRFAPLPPADPSGPATYLRAVLVTPSD